MNLLKNKTSPCNHQLQNKTPPCNHQVKNKTPPCNHQVKKNRTIYHYQILHPSPPLILTGKKHQLIFLSPKGKKHRQNCLHTLTLIYIIKKIGIS